MGWEVFLKVLASELFGVLSWPWFNLVYTLYASIQAIESDSHSRNQQCLTYWVIFALYKISEAALANLLYWFPFWPYTKGVVTILLVVPYFGGASYLYKHFIRPYISEDSFIWKWNIFSIQSLKGFNPRKDNYPDVVNKNVIGVEPQESERAVVCEGKHASSSEIKGRESMGPSSPKKVQREWSCTLCLISTSSETCLKSHYQGKKHKIKEEALRAKKRGLKWGCTSSVNLHRTNGMILLNNLNQIARAKLEKWILSPVTRSIRLCQWTKPEFGWTKLNTDGSVDRENAGCGGLLRDYNGKPICAFVSKAPGNDIFSVELWAIWRGLDLASRLGIRVIWVESDSMSVVKTINRDQPYSLKAIICLNKIWRLLQRFDKYHVSHSWRETNRAADHLAKMVILGCHRVRVGKDVIFWPCDFPDSLHNIIKDDAEGRIYLRGRR